MYLYERFGFNVLFQQFFIAICFVSSLRLEKNRRLVSELALVDLT